MKAITIAGRSTKNSEIREKEGRQFATFSLAVADGYGPNKGVMFFVKTIQMKIILCIVHK